MRPGPHTTTRPSIASVAVTGSIVFLMLFGFQFLAPATLPQGVYLPTPGEAARTALAGLGVLAVTAVLVTIYR